MFRYTAPLATAQAFFEACPEALSDFHVKLARYDITLQTLIYHEEGRKYFTKYLQSEYSEENIKFWKVWRRWVSFLTYVCESTIHV
jgi:hypothetical protein